jgi:hypothetical protein
VNRPPLARINCEERELAVGKEKKIEKTHVENLSSRVRCAPAFPERGCVDLEDGAVADGKFDVALDAFPNFGERPEVEGGVVKAAEVEVTDDFGF